jgi:uncharacterized membrane protein
VLINQCFGQRVIKFLGFSSGNHIFLKQGVLFCVAAAVGLAAGR